MNVLDSNIRQLFWVRAGKLLERFQRSQPKNIYACLTSDAIECTSISSSESLITCAESFRNLEKGEAHSDGNDTHPEAQAHSSSEMSTCDEPHSIISTGSDVYQDIDFPYDSNTAFPLSETDTSESQSSEERICLVSLFNDEIAGLIDNMILVLDDPYGALRDLPKISELEQDTDYQEVTPALIVD